MGGRNGAAKDITGSHENKQCFGVVLVCLHVRGGLGMIHPL